MTHRSMPRARRLLQRRLAGAACAIAVCAACTGAYSAPLDDIRRQVESGQFEQAWATAQAQPQFIGDVHFDFLYGVAAINSGHVPEGLLALERHLAAVPANDRARLELARGYFLLGEYTRARAEFEFVLRYNPPAGVRSNIAGFLQAMQLRESADRRASARFYAEAGFGHDSNVNGGTYRDELQLSFGNINLVGSPSQQVPDSYAQLALGGQQLLRVSNRLSVFAGADLDVRANAREHAYDLSTGGAYIGLTQLSGPALWRLTLGSSELQVGGNRYRDTASASLDANLTLNPDLTLVAFAQYGELRYASSDESQDARSTTLGLMLTQGWPELPGAPSMGLRASYTQDQNLKLRTDLSRHVPLLRLFASASAGERLRLSLGLTAFQQKYGAEEISFGSVRTDDAISVDLVANYTFDANWSLRADAVWSTNRSNHDLYDSKRSSASMKLRYQF
jgi:tetratricopeptide (TPR) repeat protein